MTREELMGIGQAVALLAGCGVYLAIHQVAGWVQEVRRWAGR